jgi:hypothetical protein
MHALCYTVSCCRFGHLGDSSGRRVTLLWSILCVSVSDFYRLLECCYKCAARFKVSMTQHVLPVKGKKTVEVLHLPCAIPLIASRIVWTRVDSSLCAMQMMPARLCATHIVFSRCSSAKLCLLPSAGAHHPHWLPANVSPHRHSRPCAHGSAAPGEACWAAAVWIECLFLPCTACSLLQSVGLQLGMHP